ncbi:MAG: hypothetical protein DMG70_02645 [Acidobacteria bacterium]|nr:MAG: hypothetical protein DMG70_02645 [Acidobacteriota bacterium]PYY08769.1 MAG: hypothetical protein DMG69_13690 [Acidobacteriota bacterium]
MTPNPCVRGGKSLTKQHGKKTLNWQGGPLLNYETVVSLIGAAKTRSGLKVKAVLDTNQYATGNQVSVSVFMQIKLRKHKAHPDWNYTISPISPVIGS